MIRENKQTDSYCVLVDFEQEHNQYSNEALNHYYHDLFEVLLIDPNFYAKRKSLLDSFFKK
jgi:hypothetical protein